MKYLFINIVSKGAKNNTYKFALAKFLLDYSKSQKIQEQDYQIDYNEIATKFLEYYWFQECKYKFKQDFNKDKMPKIIRIIQRYCGTEYIPKSFEKYFENKEEIKFRMIKEIEKECFNDVIPRFQPKEKNDYYQHFHKSVKSGNYSSSEKSYIILNKESLLFFKQEYEVLSKILVLEWAKFLEKTNFTPKLISKIELMKDPKRNSLIKFKTILMKMNQECFYCGIILEQSNVHIDHFIPWSYIYGDEVWNLVPACSKCNLIKSDSLPPKKCLIKIENRNKIYQLIKWNSSITDYYENCYKAGFKIIQEEKLKCDNF